MSHRATLAAVAALAAACAAAPDAAVDYTLVQIRTDRPNEDFDPETLRAAFDGHFANMGRMAEAGDLLVAGPYGVPKEAEDLRGIFVLDRADVEEGLALGETDPAVRAGVFRLEAMRWTSDRAPRRARELSLAFQAERGESEDPGVRAYVLVSGPADAHASALARPDVAPLVLLDGALGPPREGERLAIVLAETPDELRSLLGPSADALTFSSWWGSEALEGLAGASRP